MNEPMTVEEADRLYEGFGKPPEKEHHGEYAAISKDGRVVVGKDDNEVVGRDLPEQILDTSPLLPDHTGARPHCGALSSLIALI